MWWKKVTFQKFFIASFALSLISAFSIIAVKSYLPPVIPLFYGKPTGSDQLATTWMFFLIPLLSLAITGVNLIINMRTKDAFIKKALAVGTLFISIMATITIVKIILLIGFF